MSTWSRATLTTNLSGVATASMSSVTASRLPRPYRSDHDTEVARTTAMQCWKRHPITRSSMGCILSFAAAAALSIELMPTPVTASDTHPISISASGHGSRFMALGVGKSVVVDLPRDVKDVLVADPKVANAVIHSSQRAYIIGTQVGQTNVVFFDADGQQIAAYDIAVKRDLNGVREALKGAMPNDDVHVEGVGDGVVLSGTVASNVEAQQAGDVAARLVGSADKVVNSIVVKGRDQVMLKVTVAEVARSVIKQMGVDLSASLNYGNTVVTFNNSNPFTANNTPLVAGNGLSGTFGSTPSVTATLRAMESAGVVHTLAEPNLTAISGESATFISGGEFPIPTGVNGQLRTAARSWGPGP